MKIIITGSLDSEQRMKLDPSQIPIYQGKSRMILQKALVIDKFGHYHSQVAGIETRRQKAQRHELVSVAYVPTCYCHNCASYARR